MMNFHGGRKAKFNKGLVVSFQLLTGPRGGLLFSTGPWMISLVWQVGLAMTPDCTVQIMGDLM